MLHAYRSRLMPEFSPYEPFPRGADRAGWQALPEGKRKELVAMGEECLGFDYPKLRATDYLQYTREGDRAKFELKYMERRRALATLVIAECVEYEGRFADDIVDLVWAICEESGWQLPAHNTYVRDTPSLPLPDTSHPHLDLFACETGALLAATLYLVREKLDGVAPLVAERIERELSARIITPYLHDWFWWMGGKRQPTLNWTIWCTQNALLTAFLMPLDDGRRYDVCLKAMDSIDAFLDDYGEDGCCDEGASYFRRAGLCLYSALDVLDAVTGGLIDPIWREDKVKNIARYILNVHVDDRYYFNFADCSPIPGRAGAKEYLYGRRIGDKDLCDFAVVESRAAEEGGKPVLRKHSQGINLFDRVEGIFASVEMDALPLPASVRHSEIYYPSTGLFIARDATYALAVQSGDNADNHNHNDTGSFTLYKNGRPFLIDIGVETYSRKTFSPRRYEIWTMQSSYHNLPDFDGVMEMDGEQYRATDKETFFGDEASGIAMQLREAYPGESGLASFRRAVTLNKGKDVVVEDACDGSYKAAALNLMLCAKPEVGGSTIRVPGMGEIAVEGASAIVVEELPVEDARLRLAWPDNVYRVRCAFGKNIKLTIV